MNKWDLRQIVSLLKEGNVVVRVVFYKARTDVTVFSLRGDDVHSDTFPAEDAAREYAKTLGKPVAVIRVD